MFACGIPIFFQEVATGQYLGSGGLTMIGQLVPILQGLTINCILYFSISITMLTLRRDVKFTH
jgi:hypothetical protein